MILAGKRPAWARGLKPSDFIATAVLLTITLAIPFIANDQSPGAFPAGLSPFWHSAGPLRAAPAPTAHPATVVGHAGHIRPVGTFHQVRGQRRFGHSRHGFGHGSFRHPGFRYWSRGHRSYPPLRLYRGRGFYYRGFGRGFHHGWRSHRRLPRVG